MYITGTAASFSDRLICLPTVPADLSLFLIEGISYSGTAPLSAKVQWNHLFAKSWAQMTTSGTYYLTGAFL